MKNLNVFNISKAVGGKLYFPVDGKKPVDLDTLMMNPDGAVAFPELYGETVRTYKDIVTLYKGKEIQNAVIDNRLIEEGGLFIPIKGQKVDGHRFIEPSFEAGAMAVLSEVELETVSGPYILVQSTEQALKDLATYYREQLEIPVVGIIGSVGKTSSKEMVASVLSERYDVLKTDGNFNNEIGLPLTLLRIRDNHEVAVVEMGISDFGEMDRLGAMAKPDIVVMTNIGQCHLENLKTRDGILKAKTEVFKHMMHPGIVILNGDDDKLCTVSEMEGLELEFYGEHGCGAVLPYGEKDYDAENASEVKELFAQATDVESLGLKGMQAVFHTRRGQMLMTIPLPGEHNVYNALAATLVGLALDMPLREIRAGIANGGTISGRSNFIEHQGYTVIDDCYNANPQSMKASLGVLSMAEGRKIAVLGDMGELGTEEAALHYGVGEEVVNRHIDVLLTTGELSKEMNRAVSERKALEEDANLHFEDKESLISYLKGFVKAGDTILVKSSHFMNFPEIVKAMTE